MPNDPRDGRAVCPFYQKSRDDYICCECVIGGPQLLYVFQSSSETMAYMQEYCNTTAYLRCPYASILAGLYEGR